MPKRRINICKSTIEDAFQEGWHDTLYYYVKIRSLHENPIVYNFSYRKIAKMIDTAPSVVSKHVKLLISKDLAHVRDGHLCFYSQQTILDRSEKRQSVINLPVWDVKRKMIDELRGVLLIQKLNNQISGVFKRSELVKKCKISTAAITKKEMKFLNKNDGSSSVERNLNRKISLSNDSIGRIFNRSQSTGHLYQKRLNELGVIRSRQDIKIIKQEFSHKMTPYLTKGTFITKNGQLATQSSNIIWSPFMKTYKELLDANPLKTLGDLKKERAEKKKYKNLA